MKVQFIIPVLMAASTILAQDSFLSSPIMRPEQHSSFAVVPAALQAPSQDVSNLAGKINAAGKVGFDFQHVTVRLVPETGNGAASTAQVKSDGSFSFTGLSSTTYRLQLAGLPDGWYLRSATLGNQNVLDQGVKPSGDPGQQLEITVSPGTGKVQGIVREPVYNGIVPHAVVELFPDPANPHRADLFRATATGDDGRFVIKNVVPGKYRIIAFPGKGSDINDDSVTAASMGTRVNLGEKQSRNVELQLFEAHR
jgi:hypothetical protein